MYAIRSYYVPTTETRGKPCGKMKSPRKSRKYGIIATFYGKRQRGRECRAERIGLPPLEHLQKMGDELFLAGENPLELEEVLLEPGITDEIGELARA